MSRRVPLIPWAAAPLETKPWPLVDGGRKLERREAIRNLVEVATTFEFYRSSWSGLWK
jgi:hypothetical protein